MSVDRQTIVPILRDHVHLDTEEMADYIDGTLAPHLAELLEEHIKNCHYCTRELDLVTESGDAIVSERLTSSHWPYVPIGQHQRPKLETSFTKLWVGDDSYALKQAEEYLELWEPLGLFLPELLRARRLDLRDTGSSPFAIEATGQAPTIAPLGGFEPVGNFEDPEEARSLDSTEEPGTVVRFFVPVLPSSKPATDDSEAREILRIQEPRTPIPDPILSRLCQDTLVEICREADSKRVFLRIT